MGNSLDTATAEEASSETHFSKVEVKKLFKVFMKHSKAGKLSKSDFDQALYHLKDAGLENIYSVPFAERLFATLDVDGNGSLDFKEWIAGVSMLAKGSVQEKVELTFQAYDLDGNGFISKEEFTSMLTTAYRTAISIARFSHMRGCTITFEDPDKLAHDLAVQLSDQFFEPLDTNGDGKLSVEEFKAFATTGKFTFTLDMFGKESKTKVDIGFAQ